MDYTEALDTISEDTTVVYADPPYTRDHYSRYYHTFETICLRDVPEISTMVSKGKTQISRGIYRKPKASIPILHKEPKQWKRLTFSYQNAVTKDSI